MKSKSKVKKFRKESKMWMKSIQVTVWKVSESEVFQVQIFLQSDWIQSKDPYSVRMLENTEKTLNLGMFHAVKTGILRSSHLHMFFKTGVLKNFTIFTVKHLCWSLFLITFRPGGRYFPGNVAKFLRTTFFIEHLWSLRLNINISRRYNTKLKC